jgi:plastocyanin
MSLRLLLATVAAVLAVAPAAHAVDVTIANKAFGPTDATVASGDTVVWHWGDGPHNVHIISGPAAFDSGIKTAGSTFSRQFTAPGVYTYQCDVHPSMHGQVTVTGAGAGAPLVAAPSLFGVRVSKLAVVHATASAPALLDARIVRAGRTVKRAAARLVAGINAVPLPVRALALGRYRVTLRVVDASGRPSAPITRTLVVTRAARARRPAGAAGIAPAPVVAAPAPVADDHGGHRLDD